MGFPFVERRRLSVWLRRVAPLRWALKAAVRMLAPTHYVGAVAAVFDDAGHVLIVEHVFRTDHPWGLPGGWISRGEAPADAVARELREELQLDIEVKELIAAARIPATRMANHPSHLGLAYYARLRGGRCAPSGEVLGMRWADPDSIAEDLAPFQRHAVVAGRSAFARERAAPRT
jgi:ADP-ribose pyrophosphatase YjhB (NUDIX family)